MKPRFKLMVRSTDYKKFMRGVNKFAKDGYVLEKLIITRKWLIWTFFIAYFKLPIGRSANVEFNIGPISNNPPVN